MSDIAPTAGLPVSARSEPRSMTFADLMAIVAGVAVALVARREIGLPPYVPVSVWFFVLIWIDWFLSVVMLAASLAVLIRQSRSGRMPRPGEWMAILFAAAFFEEGLPNLDQAVNSLFPLGWQQHAFGVCRWILGGAGLAVAMAGLGVFAMTRRVLPSWVKTLVLAVVSMALLWGPIEAVRLQWSDFFPVREEFSPLWAFCLCVETTKTAAAIIPVGLMLGVPVVAALRQWRRGEARNWTWTDWIGLAVALVAASFVLLELYALRSEFPPESLRAERIVTPVWLGVVGGLSWVIVRRFGAAWDRWLSAGP